MRYLILLLMPAIALIIPLSGCQPLSKKSASSSASRQPASHSSSQSPENVINRIASDVKNDHEAIARGEEYLAKGKQENAMVYFLKALQYNKNNIKALEYIAILHYQKGNNQLAKKVYTQILAIDNNHVIANEQLGLILLNERKMSLAKQHLKKAISLNNGQWKSHNGLGIMADMESNHSAAILHYNSALSTDSSNPVLLNNLGYSYYLSGNDYEAENYFKKAIQFNNSYKRAIDNLALLKTKHKQFSAAVSLLNTVMEPYEAYNSVGYLCMIQKQYQQAELYFHKAINESPYFYPKAVENLEILNDLQAQNQSNPKYNSKIPKKVTSHTSKPVTNKSPASSFSTQKTNSPATASKMPSDTVIPITVPVVSTVNTETKSTIPPAKDISISGPNISEKETAIQPETVDSELAEVTKNTDPAATKIEAVIHSEKIESEKINTIETESLLPKNAAQMHEKAVASALPKTPSDIAIVDDTSKEKNTSTNQRADVGKIEEITPEQGTNINKMESSNSLVEPPKSTAIINENTTATQAAVPSLTEKLPTRTDSINDSTHLTSESENTNTITDYTEHEISKSVQLNQSNSVPNETNKLTSGAIQEPADYSDMTNTSTADFQSPTKTKESTPDMIQNSSEYDSTLDSTTNKTSKTEKPVIVNNDFSKDASKSQNTGESLPDSNTNPADQILKSQPEATPTDSISTKIETVTHPEKSEAEKINTIKTESMLPKNATQMPAKVVVSPFPENSSDIGIIDDSSKEKNSSTDQTADAIEEPADYSDMTTISDADFQSSAKTKENTADTQQNLPEYDTSLDTMRNETSKMEKPSNENNDFKRDASESHNTGEPLPDSNTNQTSQRLESQAEETPLETETSKTIIDENL